MNPIQSNPKTLLYSIAFGLLLSYIPFSFADSSQPYAAHIDCLIALNKGVYFDHHGFSALQAGVGGDVTVTTDGLVEFKGNLDPHNPQTAKGVHLITKSGGYFVVDAQNISESEIKWRSAWNDEGWTEEDYQKNPQQEGQIQKKIVLEGSDAKPLYVTYSFVRKSKKDKTEPSPRTPVYLGWTPEDPASVKQAKVMNIGKSESPDKVLQWAVLASLKKLPKLFTDSITGEQFGKMEDEMKKMPLTEKGKQRGLSDLKNIIDACEKIEDKEIKTALSESRTVYASYSKPPGSGGSGGAGGNAAGGAGSAAGTAIK